MCSALGLNMPKVIDVLDPREEYISKLRTIALNSDQKKLIIKPTRGRGGSGVQLVFVEDDESIRIRRRIDVISLNDLKITERYLVQEYVVQDPEIARLASSASIRLTTFLTANGEILFLNCDINTASDDHFISNWSSGGISVGVDTKTGLLREVGYDKKGCMYWEHPSSKIVFAGYTIPRWQEIRNFAVKVQNTFKYYKILGLDINLSCDGPVLYEINATPDLGASEQTNGPLLADQRIRDEFRRYDLLVNDMFQKK